MKRVVITGAGTINPLGQSVEATMKGMQEGRCGIADLDFKDVDRLSIKIGGQINDFKPETVFNRQQLSLYDRFTQFTLISAKEALTQAGIVFAGELSTKAGVVLGTAGGGVSTWDNNYRAVYEDGKNRVHPFVVPKLMNNAAASHISMEYNLKGPSFTVSTACASSNHAMAQAFEIVRSAMSPAMVTGGSESMLCFGGVKAWEGLRVMSRDACRPFSANRNGMVQGEGAAVFVFEGVLPSAGGSDAVEVIDCASLCSEGCIRPEACPSAAAREQAMTFLDRLSLDDMVGLANSSLEERTRRRAGF